MEQLSKSKTCGEQESRSHQGFTIQDTGDTDKHIFALGDAASKLDDMYLDDLFARFSGFNHDSNDPNHDLKGLQKREFQQTIEGGAKVHTTVIEGPEYQSKTVHITHGTTAVPNGPVVKNCGSPVGLKPAVIHHNTDLHPKVADYGQFLDTKHQRLPLKRISGMFLLVLFL